MLIRIIFIVNKYIKILHINRKLMHDKKEIFNILQYYLRKYTHNENGDVKYAGIET